MMKFNIGDTVSIYTGATFVTGEPVANHYIGEKLVVKNIVNNAYILARSRKHAPIGAAINEEYLTEYSEIVVPQIDPYCVYINVDKANVYSLPSSSNVLKTLSKFSIYRIVNEKDGWGKLEVGAGWINLNDAIKIES